MFTVNEVSKLVQSEPQTLRNWISSGVIVPAEVGDLGRGNSHKFNMPQVVGLIVVDELRKSERGCALPFIVDTLTAFSFVSEAWLEAEFKAGRRYFVVPHCGRPILRDEGKQFGWPDVKLAYQRVKEVAGSKERIARPKGGPGQRVK